jgi:hypothetical protein
VDNSDGWSRSMADPGPLRGVAEPNWEWRWLTVAFLDPDLIFLPSQDARGKATRIVVEYRPVIAWEVLLAELGLLAAVVFAALTLRALRASGAGNGPVTLAALCWIGILTTAVAVPAREQERVWNGGWNPDSGASRGHWTEEVGEWTVVEPALAPAWRNIGKRLTSWRPTWRVRANRVLPYEFQFGDRFAQASWRVGVDWTILVPIHVILLSIGGLTYWRGFARHRRRVEAARGERE